LLTNVQKRGAYMHVGQLFLPWMETKPFWVLSSRPICKKKRRLEGPAGSSETLH